MSLQASIDIGSNSVLLLIGSQKENKIVELIRDSRITSLGKNLDKTGVFSDESMLLTKEALRDYVHLCKTHHIQASSIIATATEASRVAKNSKSFFQEILNELNLNVHIINSKAEAELTARGIVQGTTFQDDFVIIMDIGGASTELIKVDTKNFKVISSVSLPVGSVRSTDWLMEDQFVQRLNKIFRDFESEIENYKTPYLYCVAGTMTSLGNMHLLRKEFIEDDVHGLKVSSEDIDSLFKKFSQLPIDQYLEKFPFLGKRAYSINGGIHLVFHLVHLLQVKTIEISTYGLRYGSLHQGKILDDQMA